MSTILICTYSRRASHGIGQLVSDIKANETEFEVKHVERKRGGIPEIPIADAVFFFIAAEVSKTIVKNITEAALKWAKNRIEFEGDNSQPKYLSIFGRDGIPIVAKVILPSGEVEDITDKQRPESFPTYLL